VNNIDPTGQYLESGIDIASIIAGGASFASNVSKGNVGAAIVDAVGVVVDVGALAVPGVPGGAGLGIKAVRGADAALNTAGTARGVNNAGNAASTKPDFIVNSDGATVRNSPSGARADLEAGGLQGQPITNPSGTETGTLHRSPTQNTDIRVMDGAPNHPPRTVTNRTGNPRQNVNAADGLNFGNVSRAEQRQRSHIELDPD
jgi:hypothetical protein